MGPSLLSVWVLGLIYLSPSSLHPLFLLNSPLSWKYYKSATASVTWLMAWILPSYGVAMPGGDRGLGMRLLSMSLLWSLNGIKGRITAWIHVIFQQVGADASEDHIPPCLTCELTSVRQSGWKSSELSFSHLSVCLWDVFPMNPCCVLMKV